LSLRNSVPQASAPAKLGIMNGRVDRVPMKLRAGTSLSTISHARKPPSSRHPGATPKPSSKVLSSGRHHRLLESGLASTVRQASRPSGVRVETKIRTSGATTRIATMAMRIAGMRYLDRANLPPDRSEGDNDVMGPEPRVAAGASATRRRHATY